METTLLDAFIRILAAFLLSFSFGLERQLAKKPVGFGVFTLVATGSSLITLVALSLAGDTSPLPLLGGVITGVGFLGAGAIIHYQEKAYGFTTAAAVWAFAGIGMALGAGFFEAAFLFYLLVLVVILVDRFLEGRGLGNYSRVVSLVFESTDSMDAVRRSRLKAYREVSMSLDVEKSEFTYSFIFTGREEKLEALVREFVKAEGVKSVGID